MNEAAAGMSQSLPLYLIVIGGILIIALVFLLVKMGKGKGEEAAPVAPPKEKVKEEEKLETPVKKEAPTSRHVEAESPSAAVQEEPIREEEELSPAVQREPFPETPDIGREDFDAFAGRHVLVVEDNPVNRKLILTLMAGSGIELDSAEDGNDALEKLRTPGALFDLVLMDVNMPGMDGLECTREIRKDPGLRNIPVLALTASTTPEEVESILQSGMNGYLDKPLVLGKLYTAFVRFLQEFRIPREEKSSASSKVETQSSILDTGIGLEHTNNDTGLYRMLLEDFLQQYGESPRQFRELVEAKDYDGVHRLVIDLEGLSGTLGATELYQLLLKINRILERGTTMLLADYVEEYDETFERLNEEARRYLNA